MILGALIFAAIAAAFFATAVAWELITGLALFGFIAGCATLDVGTGTPRCSRSRRGSGPPPALFSLALLVGCIWHWARYA